jgi:putative flippase GtrA
MSIIEQVGKGFQDIFVRKNSLGIVQFLRYGLISGVALGIDVGLLYVLTVHGDLPYILTTVLAFLSGMIIVYLGSIVWVFETRTVEDQRKEIIIFASIGLAGLILNEVLIIFFIESLLLTLTVAKFCTVFFVFTFNFFARKMILFRRK